MTVIFAASAALIFVYCIVRSLHWQIVWDQSVFRYIRFMMSRGLRPYSDITDMNMPGTYLMEAAGMAIFGSSDLGWRIYEYCAIATIAVSGMIIGGKRYWFTGVTAGTLFLLIRFSDGESFSMERNEIMAMLDVLAMALFFLAVQRRKPWLQGLSAALITLTAAMKPWGYLLELLILGVMVFELRHERVSLRRYLIWSLAGTLTVVAIVAGFMQAEHAWRGFFFVVKHVWPLFQKANEQHHLILFLIPKALLPLIGLAAIAAYFNRSVLAWQRWSLLLAMAAGAVFFQLEGNTASYHRYVFIVFLATWIGWELTVAMQQQQKSVRVLGMLGCCVLFVVVVPYYVRLVKDISLTTAPEQSYHATLDRDLTQLGGDQLQHQVECLDMLDGCMRALFDLRLVQNTGTTGDLFLFTDEALPVTRYYHGWYWQRQEKAPADVLVVGNGWFDHGRSFDKINAWPFYAKYVQENYVCFRERDFGAPDYAGYRILVRRGSPAWMRAQALGVKG
jgi:hypothetical protein